MKKILVPLLLVTVAFLGLFYRTQLVGAVRNIVYYSTCDTPISYSIGTIDTRFNVTPEELLTDSKIAANVWNTTQNKLLFVYDPKSTFTINMVYDSRQELTSEITKMNTDLKEQQGSIDPKIASFKKRQADFEARVTALNQKVQYWNGRGGAPKEEYDKLLAEQKSLQAEAQSLNTEAQRLGQTTHEYNMSAQELNKTIDSYKQVLQFKPEEGLYEQEGSKRKISIYIDISKDEFLHTLAHEMGHALALDHNENSKSIMYPQTTTVLQPSPEDIASLTEVCRERSLLEVAYNRIKEIRKILEDRMKTN